MRRLTPKIDDDDALADREEGRLSALPKAAACRATCVG